MGLLTNQTGVFYKFVRFRKWYIYAFITYLNVIYKLEALLYILLPLDRFLLYPSISNYPSLDLEVFALLYSRNAIVRNYIRKPLY